MVALRHLEYLQFEIFMARTARTANMSNVVKIGQPFAELLRFFDFFSRWRSPVWICLWHIRTTHEQYFVISHIKQNLVEIEKAVSII